MKTGLKFAGNSVFGLMLIFGIIAAGFSGSATLTAGVVLLAMCIGSVLSFASTETGQQSFWLYGVAHILFPALFILLSSNADADSTLAMRLSWFGVLALVGLSSFAGGYLSYRRLKQ